MKLLCEAGLSVLALNSGPRTDPAKHYRMHRQPYDLKYRGLGNPLSLAGRSHQEHYSVEEGEYTEGPELFEHDIAYSNASGTDWYWKRCKGTGGKANFWGRSSARYGDIDFKAASLDGFGEDWPVDYAEIAPWFSKAERYMGVASTVQNRPSNPDGEYLPQIPWRCLDYIIQEAGKKIGVPYLPDRCAQLTVAHVSDSRGLAALVDQNRADQRVGQQCEVFGVLRFRNGEPGRREERSGIAAAGTVAAIVARGMTVVGAIRRCYVWGFSGPFLSLPPTKPSPATHGLFWLLFHNPVTGVLHHHHGHIGGINFAFPPRGYFAETLASFVFGPHST
jgi:choline dehydrogenase-like flavoprotein